MDVTPHATQRNIEIGKSGKGTLAESIKKYRRVSDNVRDMVIQVDLNGVVYFASPSHKDVVGIDADAMIGMNAYELVHPDDIRKIMPVIRKAITERKPAKFEYRSRHADGHYIWTEANASPLIEDDGSISGAILVTRDVTEKKEAEEALQKAHDELEEKVRERTAELYHANKILKQEIEERKRTEAMLRESEERYRSIVEYTHDGIVIVNEDFRIVYANPEMGAISGYDIENHIGGDFMAFLDEKSRAVIGERKRKRSRGQEVPSVYEVNIVRRDGEPRTGEVRVSRFMDSKERACFVVHFLDITERKRAEEALLRQKLELEDNNKELEDLNTALRVLLDRREKDRSILEDNVTANIRGNVLPYIERLKRSATDGRTRSYLAVIENNMSDIISSFSMRLTSKYIDLTPREIQIANLVREGCDSKEMADLLDLSPPTIEFHRNNLRKKLDIRNRKINLRSFLLTID